MADVEKYRYRMLIPADESTLKQTADNLRTNIESPAPDYEQIVADVLTFDLMGRATNPAALRMWRQIGRDPQMAITFNTALINSVANDRDEEILLLVRAGYLLGYTQEFPGMQRFSDRLVTSHPFLSSLVGQVASRIGQASPHDYYGNEVRFDQLFEKHRKALEVKQRAAAAAAATAARRQARAKPPTRSTSTVSPWSPEATVGRSAQWLGARSGMEVKWRAANLSQEKSPVATTRRFEAAFGFLHDEIQANSSLGRAEAGLRIRAMIEYLIPRIWTEPALVDKFFTRSKNPEALAKLAKIVFIPESLRGLANYSPDQKTQIKQVHNRFVFALHTDRAVSIPDIDPNLTDYVGIIQRRVNSLWPQVNALTRT